jgi:hypothetical protein
LCEKLKTIENYADCKTFALIKEDKLVNQFSLAFFSISNLSLAVNLIGMFVSFLNFRFSVIIQGKSSKRSGKSSLA